MGLRPAGASAKTPALPYAWRPDRQPEGVSRPSAISTCVAPARPFPKGWRQCTAAGGRRENGLTSATNCAPRKLTRRAEKGISVPMPVQVLRGGRITQLGPGSTCAGLPPRT